MTALKEFIQILGFVVLGFITFFAAVIAIMLFVAAPSMIQFFIWTPVSLVILAASLFGIIKLSDWNIEK